MYECQSRAADVKYRQLRAQDINETLMFRAKANYLSVNYSQACFFFVVVVVFSPNLLIYAETEKISRDLIKTHTPRLPG